MLVLRLVDERGARGDHTLSIQNTGGRPNHENENQKNKREHLHPMTSSPRPPLQHDVCRRSRQITTCTLLIQREGRARGCEGEGGGQGDAELPRGALRRLNDEIAVSTMGALATSPRRRCCARARVQGEPPPRPAPCSPVAE